MSFEFVYTILTRSSLNVSLKHHLTSLKELMSLG